MAAVSASSMLEFVRRIFKERRDYGVLTIRQLRNMYTKEIKIKHLSSENREVFASIVTTVVKEFENVESSGKEEGVSSNESSGGDDRNENNRQPQNGNCSSINNSTDSPVKRSILRRSRPLSPSSSEDDDDVIRAVKETLGVPVRQKPCPAPATGLPEPRDEGPHPTEPTSDSDSEGRLMIAESPAASPKQPSDSEGIEGANNGMKDGEETREEPSQSPKQPVAEGEAQDQAQMESAAAPKSGGSSNNNKNHRSVDDMPLFTLKLTKTKTGSWVMVRPKSEESGGESPPQKRRRIRKLKKKTSIDDIFSSSDDEPLSQIRNRAQTQKAEEDVPSLSDLEEKLAGNKRKRAKGAKPRAKKKPPPKVAAKPDEAPALTQLKKCINVAGLRVKYVQLFANVETDAQKADKLRKVLADAGLTGKPTLKSCRKLKQQREEEHELKSLDKANIVGSPAAGRPRRSTRTSQTPPADGMPNVPRDDDDDEEEPNVFSRLKDIIDSEGSD